MIAGAELFAWDMLTWIIAILSILPAVASTILIKGPAETRKYRFGIVVGTCLPVISGALSLVVELERTQMILLPTGIVIIAISALTYCNLPYPQPQEKKVYGVVLGALAALSISGWLMVI